MSGHTAIGHHAEKCACSPEQTFVCASCKRVVGWCRGAADEFPDDCDDCAAPKLAALDAVTESTSS